MGLSDLFKRRGLTATPSVATDSPPPVDGRSTAKFGTGL
jgi:hypothetical protein